ncbi:MAG: mechanosensitive ion channel family protein [Anaerolineae bacterium]|nr:MAG: mechanosensitive ion channel family protein [Anaerolineae bacterium]
MFLHNTWQTWALALLTSLILWVLLLFLKQIALGRLRAWAQKTAYGWDDLLAELLGGFSRWVLLAVAVYAGSLALDLPPLLAPWPSVVLKVAFWLQFGGWGNVLVTHWVQAQVKKEMESGDGTSATAYGAFGMVGRIFLWVVVVLLVLDNIPGVHVTSLIAGLGIGGLAVGLALQSIFSDLFASFTIALDKPFVIGDFIVSGEYAGTVENIGLKSTRLRSLSGEEMVFANTDLLNSRIRNYKRMLRRRVAFDIGVTYETPIEKLERIPDIVREVISAQKDVTFDRAHFKSMGDFALIYEVVYHVENPDYVVYMDRQQAINLGIFRRFQEEGIEFAYPTQVLYVNQQGGN